MKRFHLSGPFAATEGGCGYEYPGRLILREHQSELQDGPARFKDQEDPGPGHAKRGTALRHAEQRAEGTVRKMPRYPGGHDLPAGAGEFRGRLLPGREDHGSSHEHHGYHSSRELTGSRRKTPAAACFLFFILQNIPTAN